MSVGPNVPCFDDAWHTMCYKTGYYLFHGLKRDGQPTAVHWKDCELDMRLWNHAIYSCQMDLSRFADNRSCEPDHHKEAAFFVRWIVHFRPIRLPSGRNWKNAVQELDGVYGEGDFDPRLALFANEYFAVMFAALVLKRPSFLLAPDNTTYLNNMIYVTHYSGVQSVRQLASEFFLLEKISVGTRKK